MKKIFPILIIVGCVYFFMQSPDKSDKSNNEIEKVLSEEEKQLLQLEKEEKERKEKEEKERKEKEEKERKEKEEKERKEKEEKERKEKEIYDKYINNRLSTGSQPYSYCFGKNPKCYPPEGYLECSGITVRSSTKSDIIVSIKKRNSDEVYKHAYIRAGESFTFNLPNGTYQPYFYYGKGWYPNKFMKNTDCGTLNGGFISQEKICGYR